MVVLHSMHYALGTEGTSHSIRLRGISATSRWGEGRLIPMLRVTAHWERPSLSAGGSKTSFCKSVILKKKCGMGVLAFALYFANVLNILEYFYQNPFF